MSSKIIKNILLFFILHLMSSSCLAPGLAFVQGKNKNNRNRRMVGDNAVEPTSRVWWAMLTCTAPFSFSFFFFFLNNNLDSYIHNI